MLPLIITDHEIQKTLTMDRCIKIMTTTFKALANGNAVQPLRFAMRLPDKRNLLGLMPGSLTTQHVMGAKIISIFHENYKKGKPSHQGVILLFDLLDGRLLSIIDAETITAIRTAAVSAVATHALAREDADEIAILGAGVQGKNHLLGLSKIRTLKRAAVWDISHTRSVKLVETESPRYPFKLEAAGTVEEAVHNSDIICTVTSAKEPILRDEWVKSGAHINAVGACTPNTRELDSDLVARSQLFTDRLESLRNESGDFLIPKNEGRIDDNHVRGELGDVLLGKIEGRRSADDITLFKSLGLAVEDLAVAKDIYRNFLKNQNTKL